MSIRLVLVDDHQAYRHCLAGLLAQHGFMVLAEADDGDALMQWLARCASLPDLVLMDVQTRGEPLAGVCTTRRALAAHPGLRVLGLSAHDDPAFATAMRAAGAVGYHCKAEPLPQLVQALRMLMAGGGPADDPVPQGT